MRRNPPHQTLEACPSPRASSIPTSQTMRKLAAISETFNIGVRACAFMMQKNTPGGLNQVSFIATIATLHKDA